MTVTRRSFLGSALALAVLGASAQAQELTADGFIELRAQRVILDLLEGGAGIVFYSYGYDCGPGVTCTTNNGTSDIFFAFFR